MAAGRKKTPDKLKLVKGTYQRCRSAKTAERQSKHNLEVPDWLPVACHPYFEAIKVKVIEVGLDSDSYAETVAMAAMRLEEIVVCTDEIDTLGRIIKTLTKTGAIMHRGNPAVAMRNEAARHLQSLLSEVGLTPSSIGKVGNKKTQSAAEVGFGSL